MAADIYYSGAQYTPGPGYPAPWPTEGSYFDKDNWLGKVLPGKDDNAIFGADQAMANGNVGHDPHILHFGNFGYSGTTVISGGSGTLFAAGILRDNWVFDFASGQNPEFSGTLTPSVGTLTIGTFVLHPPIGQNASLAIQNGTLAVTGLYLATEPGRALATLSTGATLKATTEILGVVSAGSFVQSGGSHSVSGSLIAGSWAGSTGVYTLSGGQLAVTGREYLGYNGTGIFVQTGGTHTVGSYSYLGYMTATGSYTLSGGQFTAATEYLGYDGAGFFTQTGGTHTATGSLVLGYNSVDGNAGLALYTLSDGILTVASDVIGYKGPAGGSTNGTLIQTGGTHTVQGLQIGDHGLYTLTGGILQVNGNLTNMGSLVLGGTATVNIAGQFDFKTVTLVDAGQVTINLASTGILFLPAGSLGVGTFTNSGGLIFQDGGTTTITAGRSVSLGLRSLNGAIYCAGTLSVSSALTGSVHVQGAGSVTLSGLTTDGGPSEMSGGSLGVSKVYVGYAGAGSFAQTDGTHKVSSVLGLGWGAGSSGSYALSGGLLWVLNETLGQDGTGTVAQSGGTHTVAGTLNLGLNPTAIGVYSLSAGVLTTKVETVGGAGTGTFIQTGGTHTAGTLNVGSLGLLSLTDSTLQVTGSLGNAGSLAVGGVAALQVTGALVNAGTLSLGGTTTLQAAGGLANTGALSFGGTLAVSAGGLVDLGQATLEDPGQISLTLAANSLLVLPAGVSSGQLGSFTNNGGWVVSAGSPVSIDAGTLLAGGAGSCHEPIVCAGTLTGTAALYGGIQVQGTAANVAASRLQGDAFVSSISGGRLTVAAEFVGYAGSGGFAQTNGTHTADSLYLGYMAGAAGSYNLDGGSLAVNSTEYVGYSGTGSVAQTAGTHTQPGSNCVLYLGYNAGATGIYVLSNGVLAGVTEYVGYSGTGTFVQSGGTHTAGSLQLGKQSGAVGTYVLSSGQFTVPSVSVGYDGAGQFTQTGGTYTSGTALYLGSSSGGVGTYDLSNGVLSTAREAIGNLGVGRFTQTGGTHTASGFLSIGPAGSLIVTGGTLQASGGLQNEGSLVLGGTAALTVSGWVDLGQVILQDTSQVHFTLGAQSLLLLPAGISTEQLGNFTNNGGIVASAGSTITIPAGRLVNVASGITCQEPIACAGTLTGAAKLYGGIQVSGAGAAATMMSLQVDAGISGIDGGQLNVIGETLGFSGTGSFVQSGGNHTVSGSLISGAASGATGVYILSGGWLAITGGYEVLGDSGVGQFTQTGGTHGLSGGSNVFYLAQEVGSTASYAQSGGLLSVSDENIGCAGTGSFTQTGGTHSLYGLGLGTAAGGRGAYALSNGVLTLTRETIGSAGAGLFTQSGGTHTVSDTLYVGYYGGCSGTLNMQGGTLSVHELYVGVVGQATGTVLQSGGVIQQTGTLADDWRLGGKTTFKDSAAVGVYELSGGTLSVQANFQVGAYGTGTFTQTGGLAVFNGWTSIGRFHDSTGHLIVSGGTLTHGGGGSTHLIIGEDGTGDLTITGTGVVQLATTLYVDYPGEPTGTVNLEAGGTLVAPGVEVLHHNAGGYFNFNGGTLKANASSTTFMQELMSAKVRAGGARIDTNGYTITIGQSLQEDSASRGGSLVKLGTGTLTLTGTDTHVDGLQVVAGNLTLMSPLKINSTTAARGTPAVAVDVAKGGLTIGVGGSLDLTNHDLILRYAPGTGAATLAAVVAQLGSGQITSSALTTSLALGYADNAALTVPFTSFDGIALADANQILIKYTWKGDANLDGKINFNDYLALEAGYLFGGTDWTHGDFTGDSKVTIADYVAIDAAFLAQNQVLASDMIGLHTQQFGEAYTEALAAAVPEPATLALVAAGSLLLLRRRR